MFLRTMPSKSASRILFLLLSVTAAMSIVVDVGLISGKTVSAEAGLDEPVGLLKRLAETALAVGKGRLLDSSGLLDEDRL